MCEKDSRYDDGDDDQQRKEKVQVMSKRQKRQVLAGIYRLRTRVVRSRIIRRLGECPPSMIETRAPQGSTLRPEADREGLVPRRRDTRSEITSRNSRHLLSMDIPLHTGAAEYFHASEIPGPR
jgi:hypothetical protein